MAVLFLAFSLEVFLSVNTIAHEPLDLA